MRLRFFLPGSEGIKRGRTSSVQNSVVTVHRSVSPDDVVWMPLELIARDRTNARTLATTLLCHIRPVLEAAPTCQTGCPNGPWRRTIHIVIGDGVSTSEAACKILFAFIQEKAPAHNYNMMVIRCATHQAHLAG